MRINKLLKTVVTTGFCFFVTGAYAVEYLHPNNCQAEARLLQTNNGLFNDLTDYRGSDQSAEVWCTKDTTGSYGGTLDVEVHYVDRSPTDNIECRAYAYDAQGDRIQTTNNGVTSGTGSGTFKIKSPSSQKLDDPSDAKSISINCVIPSRGEDLNPTSPSGVKMFVIF